MKRNIVYFYLFNCLALTTPATDVPGTNSASANDNELSEVMKRFAMTKHLDPKGISKSDQILGYANNMGIPVSNVVRVAQNIAKEDLARLEGGSAVNRDAQLRQCQVMLILLGAIGDASALPFLEAMSVSSNDTVRYSASQGVVNILGINSVAFLRKVVTDGRHSEWDRYNMYERFGSIIEKERKKNPNQNMGDAYRCLLELAEKEKESMAATMLDDLLCNALDGYASSIERERVAKQFCESDNELVRKHFVTIKEEIEKVPDAKRKDFRALKAAGGTFEKTAPNQSKVKP